MRGFRDVHRVLGALAVFLLAAGPARARVPSHDELKIWEGRPIATVTWQGNDKTRDTLLARFIELEPGGTFSGETARDDFRRLDDLGVFSSISLAITSDQGTEAVDVVFTFREMPWIIPYISFRFTEQDGWSVGPAVSSVNFLGRAIYLSGRVLVGGTTTYEALFRGPGFGRDSRFEGQLGHIVRQDDLNGFEENSDEFLPWYIFAPTEHLRLGAAVGFFFMTPEPQGGYTLSGDATDHLMHVGGRIAWDSRDSIRYPWRGWYNELEIFRNGGDANSWRTNLDIRRHQPLGIGHFLRLGALTTIQSGELGVDIPTYGRYFMGGANSIRGYDIDVLGHELNGVNQLILVAEYAWEFMPLREFVVFKWAFPIGARVAAFADAGIAWTDADDFTSTRAKEGAGIGLRLLVPGSNVARIDFAMGEDGRVRFHFSVWPRFDRQRDRLR